VGGFNSWHLLEGTETRNAAVIALSLPIVVGDIDSDTWV
jgi:hypothetical protein